MAKRNIARFVVSAFILGALGAGCSLGKNSGPGGQPGRTGPSFFTAVQQPGAYLIPQSEAEDLARKINPRSQGMKSYKDMAFALSQSLAHAEKRPGRETALNVPGLRVSWAQMAATLRHLIAVLPKLDGNPALLAQDFYWFRIGPDFGFTGYYEPTLEASRVKSSKYPYPLYRMPADVRKGRPYHSRNAIDRKGALAGRGLEIAWVSSEVDAFFLHVQGSGRLRFPDGSVSHVLFAGKNNQAYASLGRIMRDAGHLEPDNVNMNSIRSFLAENPHLQAGLFDQNPSYVFFREADKGPVGAIGRPLTPMVSVASDKNTIPHGSPLFCIIPLPDSDGNPTVPFYGLTTSQDSGGAIKGHRLDLFCGPGDWAAHTSGYLNAKGAVYYLVKKPVSR